jgi:hypothetical protein
MSIVSKHEEDVNLLSAQTQLRNRLQDINPIVTFYREIFEGWNCRLTLAKLALEQTPITDKRNHQILSELVSVASQERETVLESFTAVTVVRNKLEQTVQDLDLLSLRNASRPVLDSVEFDLQDIRRVLHESDALMELRDQKMKELAS